MIYYEIEWMNRFENQYHMITSEDHLLPIPMKRRKDRKRKKGQKEKERTERERKDRKRKKERKQEQRFTSSALRYPLSFSFLLSFSAFDNLKECLILSSSLFATALFTAFNVKL
jgi:hypothetical protein